MGVFKGIIFLRLFQVCKTHPHVQTRGYKNKNNLLHYIGV